MVVSLGVPIFRVFTVRWVLSHGKQSQNLDPSYKKDVDFWDYFEGEKSCCITKEIW